MRGGSGVLAGVFALCVALTAGSVAAREGAGAAGAVRGTWQAAPVYGSAGLQRRANVKALIANAPTAGPAIAAAPPRNAIGAALPAMTAPVRIAVPRPLTAPAGAATVRRGAALNGTAMGRVIAGPAPIGGPARNYSGINGTLMRVKP
jgi:hypothetical protein